MNSLIYTSLTDYVFRDLRHIIWYRILGVIAINQHPQIPIHIYLIPDDVTLLNSKFVNHLLIDEAFTLFHWRKHVIRTNANISFNFCVKEHQAIIISSFLSTRFRPSMNTITTKLFPWCQIICVVRHIHGSCIVDEYSRCKIVVIDVSCLFWCCRINNRIILPLVTFS